MSRASRIRARAEKQRIIVTCTSGNEYLIGKASLRDMALIGELSIPKKLADMAVGSLEPEQVTAKEAQAKAIPPRKRGNIFFVCFLSSATKKKRERIKRNVNRDSVRTK